MALVTEVVEKRGLVFLSTDEYTTFKIRKKHFSLVPVEVGDDIDPEMYEDRIAACQFNDAYEAALSALDVSAKTSKELERSLLNKGYVPAAVHAVVEKLCDNRLVDDRRIAERIAESTLKKPVGAFAMKRKLRAKGINEEDVESVMESFDEEQQRAAAIQAASKLYRKYAALPEREARAKLSQALARRGFAWDAVHDAVESVFQEEDYE